MKKIISIFISSMLAYFSGYCQLMENADFSINTGNSSYNGCLNIGPNLYGTAVQESPGFPNWHITHGTPNFAYNSNDVCLYGGKGVSEGIAGGYNFIAGKAYRINIGLRNTVNPSSIKIALVKGSLPYTSDCSVDKCYEGSYQGNVPSVPSGNIVYIYPSSYGMGDNCFSVPMSDNYNWIWIYCDNDDECDQLVQLTHVFISPVCVDDLYLSQSSVPNGYYTGYKRIHAGSMYGPNSLTSITNGAILEASQVVTLDHNLIAGAGRGRPFIAEVNLSSCDNCGILSKPGKDSSDKGSFTASIVDHEKSAMRLIGNGSQIRENNAGLIVSITPNPTTGKFAIVFNKELKNAKILINNNYGNSILKREFSGDNLDLDISTSPSGLYFISIIDGNQVINKKIIKR